MNALTRLLSFLLIVAIGLPAQATITALHDPTIIGNGATPDDGMNLTHDSSTDFEWLDLSLSTGMSYNSMIAQLGPGGLFAGFTHASNDEVLQLWTNLGLPSGSFPTLSSVSDGGVLADGAIDLLSQTAINANFRSTLGTTTSVTNPGNHRVLTVRHDLPATVSTTSGSGGLGDPTAGAQIGHWLYRDRSPVPEPSSLAILGMGFVGGAAFLRARRRSD